MVKSEDEFVKKPKTNHASATSKQLSAWSTQAEEPHNGISGGRCRGGIRDFGYDVRNAKRSNTIAISDTSVSDINAARIKQTTVGLLKPVTECGSTWSVNNGAAPQGRLVLYSMIVAACIRRMQAATMKDREVHLYRTEPETNVPRVSDRATELPPLWILLESSCPPPLEQCCIRPPVVQWSTLLLCGMRQATPAPHRPPTGTLRTRTQCTIVRRCAIVPAPSSQPQYGPTDGAGVAHCRSTGRAHSAHNCTSFTSVDAPGLVASLAYCFTVRFHIILCMVIVLFSN
ncbi:hypothetical protein CBL_01953 [Carabus blaptoides fortunei]